MQKPDPRQLQLPFGSPRPEAPSEDPPEPAASARTAPKILRLPPSDGPTSPKAPKNGKTAIPGARRSLKIGAHAVDYLLRRSRRRTVGFLIDDDGLRVTAPRWLTVAAIEEAILEKQRWILPRLERRQELRAGPPAPAIEWRDGAALPYLGGSITLRLLRGGTAVASFDPAVNELVLTVPDYTPELRVKDLVRDWLQDQARRVFVERMQIYAAGLGVACKGMALSSATGRWGSCSPGGKIRLSWRLIHFPLTLIDYVIAHELAHLREMNHGPRFWAAVASVFPEHQAAKKALGARAKEVMALL